VSSSPAVFSAPPAAAPRPSALWAHALVRARRRQSTLVATLSAGLAAAALAPLEPSHPALAAALAAIPLAAAAWVLPRRLLAMVVPFAVATPVVYGATGHLAADTTAATAAGLVALAVLASASSELPAIARARARRTDLVRRVAQLAGSGLPLARLLNGVLAEMAREGLRGGSVALINDRSELYIAAWEGHLDQAVLDSRLPIGQGIVGTVAATGKSMLVADMDAPARGVRPANRNLGTNSEMRSMLVVPLRTGGEVIGVLEIDSDRPDRFRRDDQAVLERIAGAIAAAAKRAGPLELANQLLSRRVQELMLLEDTARRLAGSLELSALLPQVVESAARGLAVPFVALLQVRGRAAMSLATICDGEVDRTRRPLDLRSLPVLGVSVSLGEPQTWYLGNQGGLTELTAVGGRPGLHAAVCVPVAAGEDFRGVLVASSGEARAFDPAEVRLLQGIGHLAGLAIANAESYRRLKQAAATDALTGLLNRQEFDRRLALPHIAPYAVLVVDVDRLKTINDSFGHEAGDAVLRAIARCLRNLCGDQPALARTGGDEFSVLVDGFDCEAGVTLGEQLRRALYGVAVPFGLARISVGVAAGVAGEEGWVVRDRADDALDQAKRRGRDRVEQTGSAQRQQRTPARRIEQAVRDMIAAGSVSAVYQPVVRLADMRVVGYEALARPLGAPVDSSVEALFAAAHRTGLMRDLDWLCRRAAVQQSHGLPEATPLFINVGVSALLDPLHDVDQMLLVLRWANREAREVVLEITEREVVSDLRRFEEVIATYRAQGFRFAMDDVGEGHSTLEVLASSNPEYIKVARSLTISCDRVGPRSAIHAVVAFARSSGARIIAEGIETQRHCDTMAALGVDLGQGWHLGKPAPAPGREAQAAAAAVQAV
jgi:diguanylate cyclase (GGDEF)-like protein